MECNFTEEVSDYAGRFVRTAMTTSSVFEGTRSSPLRRSTPAPFAIAPRSVDLSGHGSWFVDIDDQTALLAAGTIYWDAEHTSAIRQMAEGARDWSISRNRFWGNPIPVWKSDDGNHIEVIGSLEELEAKCGQKVTDLHKHFVDDLTWPSPDGKSTMRRIPDVLDCWFESGSMPYAQLHYPFENREFFENTSPPTSSAKGWTRPAAGSTLSPYWLPGCMKNPLFTTTSPTESF